MNPNTVEYWQGMYDIISAELRELKKEHKREYEAGFAFGYHGGFLEAKRRAHRLIEAEVEAGPRRYFGLRDHLRMLNQQLSLESPPTFFPAGPVPKGPRPVADVMRHPPRVVR